MNERYAAMCAGKFRHATASSAARQAKHTGHGHPYHCRYCSGWHISNKGKFTATKSERAWLKRKREQYSGADA